MATFYLPSATEGYLTQNPNVQFRLIVTEAHDSSGQKIRVQVYAYRTDTSKTDGQGSVSIYINGFEKYTKSFSMNEYPITSSGVYLADELITLSDLHESIEVTAKISIPNTTAGTTTNGGIINLSLPNYSITYNANGGFFLRPGNDTVKIEDSPKSILDTKPEREGFTFDGWVAKSNRLNSALHSSIHIQKDGEYLKSFSIVRKSPTVFNIVCITQNLDGIKMALWTGAPPESPQDDLKWYVKDKNNNFSDFCSIQIDVKDHIKFKSNADLINLNLHLYGIKTNYDDIPLHCPSSPYFDVEFLPEDEYSLGFGTELYAQWVPNTLTITYSANEGEVLREEFEAYPENDFIIGYYSSDGSSYQPWTDVWEYNVVKTQGLQNPESFGLNRYGYRFRGWSFNPNETDSNKIINPEDQLSTVDLAKLSDSADVQAESKTILLYAVWIPIDYTVLFYRKYGDETYIDSKVVYYNSAFGDLPILSEQHYTFLGWALEDGTQITKDSILSKDILNDRDVVPLYGQWKRTTYTIKYNKNTPLDSVKVTNIPEDIEKKSGGDINLSSLIPLRTRHTFLGWSEDKNTSSPEYSPNSTFNQDKNTVLYAIWRCDDKSVYMLRNGKIEAIGFKTDVSDGCAYIDREGYFHAKEFNTSIGSDGLDNDFAYIGKDGVVYCVEAITI